MKNTNRSDHWRVLCELASKEKDPEKLIDLIVKINQASLTMSPSVKHYMSTRQHALREERHFALLEKSAESNQGPAFNQFQVRNSVRLMHLFGPTFDHDC